MELNPKQKRRARMMGFKMKVKHWIALHDLRWLVSAAVVGAVILVCYSMGVLA